MVDVARGHRTRPRVHSPVSTLVKWFPDRRGMATGMAIMGFGGGGAMIGAPLADLLMNYFKTPSSVGVWETFIAMAAILLLLHDDRRVPVSSSASGLASGWLDLARRLETVDIKV
jgi:MFS family permease